MTKLEKFLTENNKWSIKRTNWNIKERDYMIFSIYDWSEIERDILHNNGELGEVFERAIYGATINKAIENFNSLKEKELGNKK